MKTVDLHFPKLGVTRREAERKRSSRGEYGCPWSVNCRLEGPFDRRLRGGSRPGLTKYVADDFGTSITDIASVPSSSASGSSNILLVLVDSTVKTGTGGTLATLTPYMTPDSSDTLTDDAGNRILSSSSAAPSTGFFVTGQRQAYAVNASSVSRLSPDTGQVDDVIANKGTVPQNCTFGAIYRDRLCLAGEDNAAYMSRQGDHADWYYGNDVGDNGRAIAFQLSLGGQVGPLLTAMVPHKDSSMLLASATELWVLRGDPTTGSLQRVSENVGIISSKAWCKVEDVVFFLSETGLYRVGADGSGLAPVSEESVPDELRGIDLDTTTVHMEYEHERKAVHIYLITGTDDTHWTYELIPKAFWPFRYQDGQSPAVAIQHEGNLLLGGADGYVYQVGGANDSGTGIESHVVIGPMKLGSIDRSGIINKLHGMLAAGSGTVTWRIVTGDHAEAAADNAKAAIDAYYFSGSYAANVQATDTWTAGRSNAQYPRVASPWACIWLQSDSAWAFEGGTMEIKLSGRTR